MKTVKATIICWCIFFLAPVLMMATSWASENYPVPTIKDFEDSKKPYDDPTARYLSEKFNYKKILSPDAIAELSYDVGAMKKMWAEIVGFKAPDVVNKVAPEIKPGVYSYHDKQKQPGLKALLTEYHYRRFKPGEPPFAGNYSEIKVVPTRQYYYALPIAEATKKYMGQAMLNDKTGIIKEETYTAGYPFPKPEGKYKANQVYYNWQKNYMGWDSRYLVTISRGWTGSLREDLYIASSTWKIRLQGRVMQPCGWFDKRAQEQNEVDTFSCKFFAPRDMYGNIMSNTRYLDPDRYDQVMYYVSALRRIRLMSSTDLQDSIGGADAIYLDGDGCGQKLSLTVFPSKLELVDERELLLPTNHDGAAYLSSPSKGLEYYNLEWERRPVYIVKMTELDKNFVYGHRILYFDKETLLLWLVENYDQKGRLYRTFEAILTFSHSMGMPLIGDNLLQDHLDLHSSQGITFCMPTPWINRRKTSIEYLFKKGK
ncbi:MAG: DUF1329 domain-containing protein [Desulfatitalea sp.]|nr:DUF1329 domain-containing protein [Desulfatitalea sp.]